MNDQCSSAMLSGVNSAIAWNAVTQTCHEIRVSFNSYFLGKTLRVILSVIARVSFAAVQVYLFHRLLLVLFGGCSSGRRANPVTQCTSGVPSRSGGTTMQRTLHLMYHHALMVFIIAVCCGPDRPPTHSEPVLAKLFHQLPAICCDSSRRAVAN